MPVNPRHLHILRHSLGLDDKGHGSEYRNHFVTGPGCTDWPDCLALTEAGMMTDHGTSVLYGDGCHCFTVTGFGKNSIRPLKEPLPKLSRSKARYQEWLRVADCFENFRAFLIYKSREAKS